MSTETRTDRAARLTRTAVRAIDAALTGTAARGDFDARLAIRDASEAINAAPLAAGYKLRPMLTEAVRKLNLARR